MGDEAVAQEERSLYQEDRLKVTYFPRNPDEHRLCVGEIVAGNYRTYVLQRGVLQELATTQAGELEKKVNILANGMLSVDLKQQGIGMDKLHIALCQAVIEEQKRFTQDLISSSKPK